MSDLYLVFIFNPTVPEPAFPDQRTKFNLILRGMFFPLDCVDESLNLQRLHQEHIDQMAPVIFQYLILYQTCNHNNPTGESHFLNQGGQLPAVTSYPAPFSARSNIFRIFFSSSTSRIRLAFLGREDFFFVFFLEVSTVPLHSGI